MKRFFCQFRKTRAHSSWYTDKQFHWTFDGRLFFFSYRSISIQSAATFWSGSSLHHLNWIWTFPDSKQLMIWAVALATILQLNTSSWFLSWISAFPFHIFVKRKSNKHIYRNIGWNGCVFFVIINKMFAEEMNRVCMAGRLLHHTITFDSRSKKKNKSEWNDRSSELFMFYALVYRSFDKNKR